jgi:hypothetical protein
MREAMRPYSMAVAPDSSLAKRANRVFMDFDPHCSCLNSYGSDFRIPCSRP